MAATCTIAVMFTHSPSVALALLSFIYGGLTLQQPIMFAVCLDVGGPYAGAMVGAMNMSSQLGGFLGSLVFGYLVVADGQLQRRVHPDGGPAAAGDLALVTHRPDRITHRRNRACRAGSVVDGGLSGGFLLRGNFGGPFERRGRF